MKKTTLLLVLVLLGGILYNACKKEEPELSQTVIEGSVVNTVTHEPLDSVALILMCQSFGLDSASNQIKTIDTVYTNHDGYFNVSFTEDDGAIYHLKIVKKNYRYLRLENPGEFRDFLSGISNHVLIELDARAQFNTVFKAIDRNITDSVSVVIRNLNRITPVTKPFLFYTDSNEISSAEVTGGQLIYFDIRVFPFIGEDYLVRDSMICKPFELTTDTFYY